TPGDDVFVGTNDSDYFDLTQGGNDTVHGKDGSDTFYFGATLTSDDFVDGGAQSPLSSAFQGDTVDLSGDYTAGLTLSSHWIRGIETFHLHGTSDGGGGSYNLTLGDANVVDSDLLTVFLDDGSPFPADSLDFDGSAEDEADMLFLTLASGTDHIVAGGGN